MLKAKSIPWLWLTFCTAVYAQSGLVRSANQTIPGATVTATSGDKKFVTTTGPDGRYTLPQLDGGTWTIEVEMFGFEPAKKEIDFSKTKVADFTLQLRPSQMAGRMAQFAGMRNGAAANQLDSQIQSELNAGLAQQAPPTATQNSNEAFLISGSLSQGLASNAQADYNPGQFGFGGRGGFGEQTPNAPGFGGNEGGGA
ncbi:MAG TPA: carboxypeptidase-like regulatory domain-containing protein, partial [Bryobacteraceae bacterium]|nr:carboxypeptidase-like regulatory domain-containing protein [Bryobacteraceae bacterium]